MVPFRVGGVVKAQLLVGRLGDANARCDNVLRLVPRQAKAQSLGIDNGDNASNCSYIRCYEHSGSTMVDYALDFPNAGHGAATYFLHAGCTGGMLEVGDISSGNSITHGLRVLVGSTVLVIPLYED